MSTKGYKLFETFKHETKYYPKKYMKRFAKLGEIPLENMTRKMIIQGTQVGKTRLIMALDKKINYVEYDKQQWRWQKHPDNSLEFITRAAPINGSVEPTDGIRTSGFLMGMMEHIQYDFEKYGWVYSREFNDRSCEEGVINLKNSFGATIWQDEHNELIMKELNEEADVYFIDELGKQKTKPQAKDRIMELMSDPSNFVIATAPKGKAEYDEGFVQQVKDLSQKTFNFNKYTQQNQLYNEISSDISNSYKNAEEIYKKLNYNYRNNEDFFTRGLEGFYVRQKVIKNKDE